MRGTQLTHKLHIRQTGERGNLLTENPKVGIQSGPVDGSKLRGCKGGYRKCHPTTKVKELPGGGRAFTGRTKGVSHQQGNYTAYVQKEIRKWGAVTNRNT